MKANELRTRNWITWQSTPNDIEKVLDIKTAGIKNPTINNVNIKDVKPIPLTEEWLLKFGFERGNLDFQFAKDPLKVCLDGDGYRVYIVTKGWNIDLAGNVYKKSYEIWDEIDNVSLLHNQKHVHQLQNLYFALTGEEL